MKMGFLEKQIFKNNIFISNFFTGVLSTLLATPCTAPLVGTAVSFALSQNYFLSILVFLLMGTVEVTTISYIYNKAKYIRIFSQTMSLD